MKMVGLRFLLTYGSFMIVVVTEEQARQWCDLWQSDRLRGAVLGGTNQYGCWSVKLDSVIGMHTVPLEALMQQAGQHGVPTTLPSTPVTSGVFPNSTFR